MEKKVLEKPKRKPKKFDRNDHTFRDQWIERALQDIKFLKLKHVKTSRRGEFEPCLFFRKVKVLQCAHSAKAYFTGYLFKPGSRQIVRVTDDDEAQLLYDLLLQRIQQLEEQISGKGKK